MLYVIVGVAAFVAGGAVVYFITAGRFRKAGREAERIVDEATRKAEKITLDAELAAKEQTLKVREDVEKEYKSQREELASRERRVSKREDNLDRKLSLLDKRENTLHKSHTEVEKLRAAAKNKVDEAEQLVQKQDTELKRISGLTEEEARREVIRRIERTLDDEMNDVIKRRIARARERSDSLAREHILDVIKRCAVDTVSDNTVSSVELPSDEMKGRVIGREGRNIRSFEAATGVDVIVDDTPGVVVLSSFDPMRREVASRAMAKLLKDGRIHPSRIEEVVGKVQEQVGKEVDEAGKQAVSELGVMKLTPRLVSLVGRLRFRTSYGQNCLQHSIEVAYIASMLATELGLDPKLSRLVGLLHDIGKALDHEEEGTHPALGAEVAKNAGQSNIVVNAIAAHHEDLPAESLYATLVQVADAISAARPGARRASVAKYLKRLEQLEGIAAGYDGVEKAYAIQAGREIRVIAKAEQLSEADCHEVCRKIAKRVEEELSYPGEVKITMIREKRFIEYAR